MAINTATNFSVGANLPIDDRLVVNTYSDLTNLLTYEGLVSYVLDEKKEYIFKNNQWNLYTIDYNNIENKPTIPKNVSELVNDSNFTNKTYVDDLVSRIPKFAIIAVDELPTTNISSTTVYLLKVSGETSNLYEEYIYVNNAWELLGTAKVDLSNYYTKNEIGSMIGDIDSVLDILNGEVV